MHNGKEDASIAAGIIGLTHSIGVKTIAEGIETDKQRSALTQLRCDIGQGFLWGQGISASQALDLLEHHSEVPATGRTARRQRRRTRP